MITRIVRIGNSQGIRIPKPFIQQTGLGAEVELLVTDDSLVIKPATKPRSGWGAAFQEMAACGDDALLDDVPVTESQWDEEEWQW